MKSLTEELDERFNQMFPITDTYVKPPIPPEGWTLHPEYPQALDIRWPDAVVQKAEVRVSGR